MLTTAAIVVLMLVLILGIRSAKQQSTMAQLERRPTNDRLDQPPIAQQPRAEPSIAIDQATLLSTSSEPTVSGTASGVNLVSIIVRAPSAKFSGWAEIGTADNIPVTNGHWSIRLTESVVPTTDDLLNGLTPGTYLIDAIADVDHQETGMLTIAP